MCNSPNLGVKKGEVVGTFPKLSREDRERFEGGRAGGDVSPEALGGGGAADCEEGGGRELPGVPEGKAVGVTGAGDFPTHLGERHFPLFLHLFLFLFLGFRHG